MANYSSYVFILLNFSVLKWTWNLSQEKNSLNSPNTKFVLTRVLEVQGNLLKLDLIGDFDCYSFNDLKNFLKNNGHIGNTNNHISENASDLRSNLPGLIFSLDSCRYIDSAGIGFLSAIENIATRNESYYAVVTSNAQILKVFSITGLNKVLKIYPSFNEAIADYNSRNTLVKKV